MKLRAKPLSRRATLQCMLGLTSIGMTAAPLLAGLSQAQAQTPDSPAPRQIDMTAQRFKFTPEEIPLKAGERVVLAIKSLDFIHGMHIPDLGVRVDLLPGQITRIEIQPQHSGIIDFLCDNFCGGGHEDMHGRFIVSA